MGAINLSYTASSQITITLSNLASSSTRVAGRESNEVTNTSQLNYAIGGFVTEGTTPGAGQADVWVWGSLADTPVRPDLGAGTALTGADAAATFATADIRNAAMRMLGSAINANTTAQRLSFAPVSLLSLFGWIPNRFGLWVAHSNAGAVALSTTAGAQAFYYTPTAGSYT